jgi:hypothetical protein
MPRGWREKRLKRLDWVAGEAQGMNKSFYEIYLSNRYYSFPKTTLSSTSETCSTWLVYTGTILSGYKYIIFRWLRG